MEYWGLSKTEYFFYWGREGKKRSFSFTSVQIMEEK